MLHQIFAITLKDLKVLLRDRGGLVTLFLMPVMFILVMSSALKSQFEIGSSDKPIEILVVNQDEGALAQEAIDELNAVEGVALIAEVDGQGLTRASAEDMITDNQYNVALIFPADFTEKILAAAENANDEDAVVTFIVDPTTSAQFLGPIRGSVEGFIQSNAAYAQVPTQLTAGFETIAAEVPAEQSPFVLEIGKLFVDEVENGAGLEGQVELGVRFEQQAPASYVVEEFPTSVEQNVPGYTVFGIFYIVQVLATSMLSEKQEGTFRRLLVAPLSRHALLLGKLLPYYLVNILQVGAMFTIGAVVFDMNLGNSFPAMLLVTLAVAASATGLGLLVAAIGKTIEQVGSLSGMLALTLAAIGGMMVPSFVMPEFMQQLGRISPHYWALAGYQDIIVRGLGFNAVMNEVAVLLSFAAVFFVLAVWRFRFQEA